MAPSRRDALGSGLAVVASVMAGCLGSESDDTGRTLETLDAPGSSGNAVPLIDAEPTLLYFFATWCAPCDPQNEALAAVDDRVDDDLAMRAISPESDVELVREYWTESPASFPVGVDEELRIHDVYDVTGYPSLVLVDRDGAVRWERTGLADAETVLAAIDDVR